MAPNELIKNPAALMSGLVSKDYFLKGMKIIETHYRNQSWSKDQAMMMYEMLSDMTGEQFQKGVKTFCLKHKEIYPNTNIIAYIREYGFVDQNRMSATEAWGEVLKWVSKVGSYGKPEFSDETVAKAVECIGWRDICSSENVGVERAHFMRAYESLVNRDTFNAIAGNI